MLLQVMPPVNELENVKIVVATGPWNAFPNY